MNDETVISLFERCFNMRICRLGNAYVANGFTIRPESLNSARYIVESTEETGTINMTTGEPIFRTVEHAVVADLGLALETVLSACRSPK